MKCTVCGAPMKYKGGENKEDFGCSDRKHCPCSEIGYYPHMGVRENWWFATQYHLPFKFDDKWYAATGPRHETIYSNGCWINTRGIIGYGERTIFQTISPYKYKWLTKPGITHMESKQEYLFSIPYIALPVNDDFLGEFNKLKSKFEKYILLK